MTAPSRQPAAPALRDAFLRTDVRRRTHALLEERYGRRGLRCAACNAPLTNGRVWWCEPCQDTHTNAAAMKRKALR